MDLNHVAVFVRVAEAQSFTAAAAALGLPKSSVSRAVARLEDDLGVRLLQRTTRKLALTDAGRQYFERARAAMSNLEDASAAVADMGREPRGTVRLTAPVDLGNMILADAIAAFVKKHPKIRVELSFTARIVDLVEEGFDLAVRAGRLEDSSLVARRIGASEIALFASTKYLKRHGRPKVLADLARHACVLFRSRDMRTQWRLVGPRGEESVQVNGPVEVDDLMSVHRFVLAEVGIGMLPMWLAGGEVQRGVIERVLPDHAFRGGALHVVSPPRQYEPARVALLRDFLVETLSNIPWDHCPDSKK